MVLISLVFNVIVKIMFNALIIDDDPIQLRIAELLVKRSSSFSQLVSYKEAEQALRFLENEIDNATALPDVILLDLNMPKTDGWAFLNIYKQILPKIKKKINLFIVSSSIDKNDQLRSETYPFVNGFISKPMSPATLQHIAMQIV